MQYACNIHAKCSTTYMQHKTHHTCSIHSTYMQHTCHYSCNIAHAPCTQYVLQCTRKIAGKQATCTQHARDLCTTYTQHIHAKCTQRTNLHRTYSMDATTCIAMRVCLQQHAPISRLSQRQLAARVPVIDAATGSAVSRFGDINMPRAEANTLASVELHHTTGRNTCGTADAQWVPDPGASASDLKGQSSPLHSLLSPSTTEHTPLDSPRRGRSVVHSSNRGQSPNPAGSAASTDITTRWQHAASASSPNSSQAKWQQAIASPCKRHPLPIAHRPPPRT